MSGPHGPAPAPSIERDLQVEKQNSDLTDAASKKDRLTAQTEVISAPSPAPLAASSEGAVRLKEMHRQAADSAASVTDELEALIRDGKTKMPDALVREFKHVEDWAQANKKDARRDAVRFWSLKIPTMLVSVTTGVLAFYGLKSVSVIAGAVGSFCVLMDGLNPGGTLRNVHLRAVNELRILQHNMLARWDKGVLRGGVTPNWLAAEIIQMSADEKVRINKYLTEAETSQGTGRTAPPRSLNL